MDLDELRRSLDLDASWTKRGDGCWVEAQSLDPCAVAHALLDGEARFVTMSATPDPGGGYRLIYHWDLDGSLLHLAVRIPGPATTSIAAVCPAADWVERELRDYYGLEFHGRDGTPPLMLREDDEPALFSRTAELGRDTDPADTARRTGAGPAPQPAARPAVWQGRSGATDDAEAVSR